MSFNENRWRLPVRLLAFGALMVLIGLAQMTVPLRQVSAAGTSVLGAIVLITGAATSGWGIYRALRPVAAIRIGSDFLSVRCREFEKGWADVWLCRRFEAEQIDRIEIGRRLDYPRARSYSDTASYEFLLVVVRDAQGDLRRYAYAPLQRLAHRELFLSGLSSHRLLREKVKRVDPERAGDPSAG